MGKCEKSAAQDFLWLKENYTQIYERMAQFRAKEYAELSNTAQKLLRLSSSAESDIAKELNTEFNEGAIRCDTKWLSESYAAIYDKLRKVRSAEIEGLQRDFPEYLHNNDPLSPLDCAVDFFTDRRNRRSETEYCRHLANFLNDKSLGQKLLDALVTLAGIEDSGPFILISADTEEYCRKGLERGRLDVVIYCKDHKKVIIESKIDSVESKGQTQKYIDNDTFEKNECSYIMLTLEAFKAEAESFKSVSWFDMAASFYAAVKSANIQCNYLPYFKIWLGSIVQELYELNFSKDSGESVEQLKCFIENKKYYGD